MATLSEQATALINISQALELVTIEMRRVALASTVASSKLSDVADMEQKVPHKGWFYETLFNVHGKHSNSPSQRGGQGEGRDDEDDDSPRRGRGGKGGRGGDGGDGQDGNPGRKGRKPKLEVEPTYTGKLLPYGASTGRTGIARSVAPCLLSWPALLEGLRLARGDPMRFQRRSVHQIGPSRPPKTPQVQTS